VLQLHQRQTQTTSNSCSVSLTESTLDTPHGTNPMMVQVQNNTDKPTNGDKHYYLINTVFTRHVLGFMSPARMTVVPPLSCIIPQI